MSQPASWSQPKSATLEFGNVQAKEWKDTSQRFACGNDQARSGYYGGCRAAIGALSLGPAAADDAVADLIKSC